MCFIILVDVPGPSKVCQLDPIRWQGVSLDNLGFIHRLLEGRGVFLLLFPQPSVLNFYTFFVLQRMNTGEGSSELSTALPICCADVRLWISPKNELTEGYEERSVWIIWINIRIGEVLYRMPHPGLLSMFITALIHIPRHPPRERLVFASCLRIWKCSDLRVASSFQFLCDGKHDISHESWYSSGQSKQTQCYDFTKVWDVICID